MNKTTLIKLTTKFQ